MMKSTMNPWSEAKYKPRYPTYTAMRFRLTDARVYVC